MALVSAENLVYLLVRLVLGALFATLIYSVSVVSMPMILHRRTDAISAGLTSMRLVLTQTPVMLFWGVCIATLVLLASFSGAEPARSPASAAWVSSSRRIAWTRSGTISG